MNSLQIDPPLWSYCGYGLANLINPTSEDRFTDSLMEGLTILTFGKWFVFTELWEWSM